MQDLTGYKLILVWHSADDCPFVDMPAEVKPHNNGWEIDFGIIPPFGSVRPRTAADKVKIKGNSLTVLDPEGNETATFTIIERP